MKNEQFTGKLDAMRDEIERMFARYDSKQFVDDCVDDLEAIIEQADKEILLRYMKKVAYKLLEEFQCGIQDEASEIFHLYELEHPSVGDPVYYAEQLADTLANVSDTSMDLRNVNNTLGEQLARIAKAR
jgi:hypothetical protein